MLMLLAGSGSGLIGLLVLLIIVGAGLYLLSIVPMDARIKQIIYVVIVVAVLIYVLKNFLAPML